MSQDASVGGARIAAPDFIQSFYALRNHDVAWLGKPTEKQLFTEIVASQDHGLRPEDFHLDTLTSLREAARTGDHAAVAEYEIVATDAAIRLLHHLYFGKVNPERLDPDWNFERPIISGDPVELFSDYIAADGYSVFVQEVAPKHPSISRFNRPSRGIARSRQKAVGPRFPRTRF